MNNCDSRVTQSSGTRVQQFFVAGSITVQRTFRQPDQKTVQITKLANYPHKLTKTAEPWLGGGAALGGSELQARGTSAAISLPPLRVREALNKSPTAMLWKTRFSLILNQR